jgi:signal transduction histidine kinase/CheY-like chemotaxis protein
MITLVAELLFAVIFARALTLYVRDRDPLQRSVALIFLPSMVVFLNSVLRAWFGPLPVVFSAIATVLLLIQPYLTLRLTARMLLVPRWVTTSALFAYVASAIPLAVAPRPLGLWAVMLLVGAFIITEIVAATFLLRGTSRRRGAARVQLWLAASSTYLFASMMVVLGLGALFKPGVTSGYTSVSRVIALLSAIGYMIAFMPPAWLRRIWSAASWYTASDNLQVLPATATAEQVWQRYTEIVGATAGAQAAVLVSGCGGGGLVEVACHNLRSDGLTGYRMSHLDQVTHANQPVTLPANDTSGGAWAAALPPLAVFYARAAGARHVTAVPLDMTATERGAVLLLDRYRGLFNGDDLRLVAALGRQAAVLAERGAIMSEQRRLAKELAESVDALTHASQAKSDFLAGMSHELRTPLNAIIGFSDLMRAEQPDGARRSVPAEWVDHIHGSGRHLLGLINDILDLAKVEAGRLELHPVPLRLDTTIHDVITGLRPLTERKQLLVRVHIPPVGVRADPLRFRQVLDNLLSNAIKFTPEGGSISVSAARVGSEVAITVADSGVGIAAEHHTLVFEEFRQLGDAAQRKAGTGLGLALTRRLVEAHGGSVSLQSSLGEGSRFTVRLPDATAEMPQPDPSEPVVTEPRSDLRGRVLIIDDDARAAELLSTYLKGAGYDVAAAPDGKLGLLAARTWRPGAILLDVIMPGIDGWEVIRELKTDESLRDIPVFFASIIDERRAGIALGATDYFVKPVDHEVLLTLLAQHIMPAAGGEASAVLVVDRDDNTRRVVEAQLRTEGVDVVVCDDGGEGLRLSQQRRFDLIICDLQRPEINGFALLRDLQGDPKTRGTPVLALTAADLSDADRIMLAGKVIGTVPRTAATSCRLREWVDLAAVANVMSHPLTSESSVPSSAERAV